jgi:hypothetical protein
VSSALDVIGYLELGCGFGEGFTRFDRTMTRIGSPARQRFIPHAGDQKRSHRTAFR